MAWSAGPGEIASIAFGATTVTADLIDGYSLTTEKDSYGSGLGHAVDRGSAKKMLSANVYDVSAINAIHTLMTARTASTVTVTYQDAATQALNECIVRVTPLLQNVSDVCKVWFDATDTTNVSIASNWTDCGSTLDVPSTSFTFPFDGTQGHGLPYFSTVGSEVEFLLPADKYSVFTEGAAGRIAFQLPDGNYQVMDGRIYKNYADDDMSRPRAVRVVLRGVATSWGDLIEFCDESGTPTIENFNASSPTIMQDKLHGILVEASGFGYAESEVTTF